MISCFHLTIHRPGGGPLLFDAVSLEIQRQEFVEIIGPSGSGKSVLCSLLSVRRRAKNAKCIIAGRNLERLSASGLAELRQVIGACTQSPEFLESRSVLENLLLPFIAREQIHGALGKVQELVAGTPLEALSDVPVRDLAQAERQLTAVMRALVGRPEIIILDGGLEGLGDFEPVAATALARAHRQGATVVLAAREVSCCGALRTRVMRLQEGRLESDEAATPPLLRRALDAGPADLEEVS